MLADRPHQRSRPAHQSLEPNQNPRVAASRPWSNKRPWRSHQNNRPRDWPPCRPPGSARATERRSKTGHPKAANPDFQLPDLAKARPADQVRVHHEVVATSHSAREPAKSSSKAPAVALQKRLEHNHLRPARPLQRPDHRKIAHRIVAKRSARRARETPTSASSALHHQVGAAALNTGKPQNTPPAGRPKRLGQTLGIKPQALNPSN